MVWVRFDDGYLGNDKLKDLSTDAIALDMGGIIYSAHNLRDGLLTRDDVRAVAAAVHMKRWERPAAELVTARRWTLEGDGYAIHDYLDYQPPRSKVLAERAAAAERKRKVRSEVRPDEPPDGRPESGPPRNPDPDPILNAGLLASWPGSPTSAHARGAAHAADVG